MYSHTEQYVYDLLKKMNITSPDQLTIENISAKFGLTVIYSNKTFKVYDMISIEHASKQRQWQLFGHELCHYLRHYGSHLKSNPLFIDHQEGQADYFSYHFCVPTFMLDKMNSLTIYKTMNLFNVEHDFAIKRLEMYENKVISRGEVYANSYIR